MKSFPSTPGTLRGWYGNGFDLIGFYGMWWKCDSVKGTSSELIEDEKFLTPYLIVYELCD